MTDLIACLSENEKGRIHIQKLVEGENWTQVFLVTTESSKKGFSCEKEVQYVIIDMQSPASEMIKSIQKQLHGKLNDLEVALNMVCGSGKEHMALLSALVKMGMGIRLMAVTKEGIKEL